MQQMHDFSSLVAWAMVCVCLLAVGFMVRCLGAFLAEENKSRARSSLRLRMPQDSRSRIFAQPLEAAFPAPSRLSRKTPPLAAGVVYAQPVARLEMSGRW